MAADKLKRLGRSALTPEDPWAYGVYVLIALAAFVFFFLPDMLVARGDFDDRKEWYKARNDVRTSGIQLLGGFVLVVGSYFTARTLRLNRAGHITDRFSKAVEHLAGEEPATRLGGIYALERVMRDSSEYQGPVLEILTAFVRVEGSKQRRARETEPVEVGAALRVIGRRDAGRDPRDEKFRLNLSETNLSYCSMRDGDFSRANLSRTDLRNAYLVRSSFRGALLEGTLLGGAKVEGADFSGARYDDETDWPGVRPEDLGAVKE